MLSKLTPGRIVANALVAVIAAILLAAAADYVAAWMGFSPRLVCGVMPELQAFCWTAAIVMTFIGAVIWLFRRNTTGTALFFGGLLVGLLPVLANGYMVRLLGIGCSV